MDIAGKVGSSFSLEALKEPRGFIRLIEWILAIFAFATVCSFTAEVQFSVKCANATETTKTYTTNYAYPFDLTSDIIKVAECDGAEKSVHFSYGPKSPAEFYVFIGVMAFLYTMGAFVLYVFFDDLYRKNNTIVIVDFIFTAVWAFLWLVSSSVWAQGVVDLKFYSDPIGSGMLSLLTVCKTVGACVNIGGSTYAGLNVSIIFGFLNCVVWVGNCWFLWKITLIYQWSHNSALWYATFYISHIFRFLNCVVWVGNCWFLWKETPWFINGPKTIFGFLNCLVWVGNCWFLWKCKNKWSHNSALWYATFYISHIFGFLNCVVWVGNCWFLWKETPWFKSREEDYIPDPGTIQPPTPDSNSPAPLY